MKAERWRDKIRAKAAAAAAKTDEYAADPAAAVSVPMQTDNTQQKDKKVL